MDPIKLEEIFKIKMNLYGSWCALRRYVISIPNLLLVCIVLSLHADIYNQLKTLFHIVLYLIISST